MRPNKARFLPPQMSREKISPINCQSFKVLTGGKPPKLRFRPGTFYVVDGSIMMLAHCYRVKADPHTWLFCLEEVDAYSKVPSNEEQKRAQICYDLFYSSMDAHSFFRHAGMQHSSIIKNVAGMNKLQSVSMSDPRIEKALGKTFPLGEALAVMEKCKGQN